MASTQGSRRRCAVVAAVLLGCAVSLGCGGARRARVADGASSPAPSGAAGPAIATVTLRDYGNAVATAADGRVYVTVGSGRLLAVDPIAARVAAEIPVDGEPYAVAVTPDGRRAYVVDLRAQHVSVVDTTAAKVKTRIPLGTRERPSLRPSAAASRDGRRVYVGDTARDHLVVIGTDADQVTRDLFLDLHPAAVAPSSDGNVVYVAGCRDLCTDGTLLAIDAAGRQILRRFPLRSVPAGLVVTPDGRRAYVANGREGTVTAVDLASGAVTDLTVGPEPVGIAIASDGSRVYVTSFQAGTLSVIATATDTVVATLRVGRTPRAVAVGADGTRAYVTHSTSVLSIVDLRPGG